MLHKSYRDVIIEDVYFKQTSKRMGVIQDTVTRDQTYYNNRVDQLSPDIPSWREIIARNEGATTTIEGDRVRVTNKPGYHQLILHNGLNVPDSNPSKDDVTYDWYGFLMKGAIPSPGVATSAALAESRASEKFLAAAQRELSAFQGGVFIGELRRAIRGIRHPAEALKEYLQWHALRAKARRDGKTGAFGKKLNKAISDLWLERSYQWLPLVSDLESAAEQLARIGQLEDSKTVSGTGSDDNVFETGILTNSKGPLGIRYRRQTLESSICRFYGKVAAFNDVDPESFATFLTRRLGLNLAQALPTAWELIPFSFVADYFSNLGAMISAYSFPISAIRWVNKATLKRTRLRCLPVEFVHSPNSASQRYEYTVEDPGIYTASVEAIKRQPWAAENLLPDFRLTVPGVADWPKWLNLTALANSLRQ